MNKKIVFAIVLFIVMILVIPSVQSILFASQATGKMVIEKKLEAPYLHSSQNDMILVFFGYVGCAKVCTPILHELDQMYDSNEFGPFKERVDLMFVNLLPELEPNQPEVFAKSFNERFMGVYLSQSELMRIDRELGVFFSKSIGDATEIDHSDNLYLVQKLKDGTFILKSIYSMHPLNRELLINDISELSKAKE